MATVLLIVTIPTESEEQRKRQEQLSKKPDIDMSIGRSSCRSRSEVAADTENSERPHIHEAVKKAFFILNNSQQRNQSSVYPRASEIFDLKHKENFAEQNSRMEREIAANASCNETLIDPLESSLKEQAGNVTNKLFMKGATSKAISHDIMDETTCTVNSSKMTEKKKSNAVAIENEIYNNKSNNNNSNSNNNNNNSNNNSGSSNHNNNSNNNNYVCLETVMRAVFKELGISNAIWTQTSDGRMYQILFTISFDEAYEELLCELHEKGIGERAGSTIVVLNCIASKKPSVMESHNGSRNEVPIENADDRSTVSNEYFGRNGSRNRSQTRYRKGVWERFMNSVRSRLNIAQIIRCVRQDATIDFDFMILLISAALLSAFGLIDDSLVFLASSMLISPLMGPIIAAIFGTAIKDPILCNMGIRNECYGILVAFIVGFCFGIFVCIFNPRFESMEAITNEMVYRGSMHTLIMCSIAAIPSGAAVAIGILNGNMGSLIGVAISASLLPPAVNSGMLWAMIIFCLAGETNTKKGLGIRERFYFDDTIWDFIAMSGVSMGITVLNILLVFGTGVILLKVKEIVPGIGGNNREFWKRDIKIARNISQQNLSPNAAILEELSNLPSEERNAIGIDRDMLRCINVPESVVCQHSTWSPGYLNFENRNSMQSAYATVHRLDYLYSTITQRGCSEDFSADFATRQNSQRRTADFDTDTYQNEDDPFKYFVRNERQRDHNENPQNMNTEADAHAHAHTGAHSTLHAQQEAYGTQAGSKRHTTPVGQVRRFFITPVENTDQEPNEYDV